MEKKFKYIVVALTIFRLLLAMRIPFLMLSDAGYDDALMFEHAYSLSSFNWLGDYNKNTLVKGISYSIFLATINKFMIPYSVGLSLLNFGSAYLFVHAIQKIQNKRWLNQLIYVLLIYSPLGFDTAITQRMYRMAIVPYAALFVFACMIGMYVNRNEKLSVLTKYAIMGG